MQREEKVSLLALSVQGIERKKAEDHKQTLRDQAQDYYTGIMASIDPEATVAFEFAQ